MPGPAESFASFARPGVAARIRFGRAAAVAGSLRWPKSTRGRFSSTPAIVSTSHAPFVTALGDPRRSRPGECRKPSRFAEAPAVGEKRGGSTAFNQNGSSSEKSVCERCSRGYRHDVLMALRTVHHAAARPSSPVQENGAPGRRRPARNHRGDRRRPFPDMEGGLCWASGAGVPKHRHRRRTER